MTVSLNKFNYFKINISSTISVQRITAKIQNKKLKLMKSKPNYINIL